MQKPPCSWCMQRPPCSLCGSSCRCCCPDHTCCAHISTHAVLHVPSPTQAANVPTPADAKWTIFAPVDGAFESEEVTALTGLTAEQLLTPAYKQQLIQVRSAQNQATFRLGTGMALGLLVA
jgi:hypothetical protein